MAGSPITRFYRELKRRKVIRVAVAYVIVSWIIVEVASVMFPGLLLPDWSVRLVIALVVIGFPIALILAWAIELTPDGPQMQSSIDIEPAAEQGEEADPVPEAVEIRSVAVMPFLNLSNDPDNEYFSDGMSEEVLNLLCKLPQLTVASRTSSFSFKGKDVDMATVANRLGVDAILEGSVRRSEERVRISAQLIDGRADRYLWSENYDRELNDVFAVQNEIARSIVSTLELSLTPEQQHLIQKQPTTENMAAYDFYLRGRYYVERGEPESGQRMFEQAIALDDQYALAWAGAADCHSWRCMWFEHTREHSQKAAECSAEAMRLAPGLAEAHASRSYAMAAIGNYQAAEAAFKSAVELDPQLFEAYYYGGRAYFAQARFEEAVEAFTEAARIRPDDPSAASLLSIAMKPLGHTDEFETVLRRGIEVSERHLTLNPDDALAWSRAAGMLIDLGETEKAVEYAERGYAIKPQACGYNVACVLAEAGQSERALDILEHHAQSAGILRDWIENDADWDALRDHPRFREILELAT